MTASAASVVAAPVAMISSRPRFRASCRRQCTTMPTWLIVKVRKAPIAKRGISRSVMPPNRISKPPAVAVSTAIPTEKTSRRSATAKLRGRKPSSATIRHNRGKATKLVLADRHSTASRLAIAMK